MKKSGHTPFALCTEGIKEKPPRAANQAPPPPKGSLLRWGCYVVLDARSVCALQRFGQDLGQQVDRLERGEEREQRGGRTDDGEDRKQDHALLGREAS